MKEACFLKIPPQSPTCDIRDIEVATKWVRVAVLTANLGSL